ncbi:hypothetical protein [Chondrinema litorale]|uniref:hypothetical protein n=1 Tax=Chondrinema litorale TaxID=2994555 RepID=UPI0025431AF3|nr:hypothetical protein [Chondrinema litorale]UZR94262.1 hypothetical protein OQ292_00335 [Chondrinema litorale]
MKYFFQFILILFFYESYSQDIQQDSLLLKKIFERNDVTTTDLTDPETYQLVFNEFVDIDNQSLFIAIIDIPVSQIFGHTIGYRNYYFFEQVNDDFIIIDAIVSDGDVPIGDNSEFEIIDIGKDKQAITSTFESTGNHHYEKKTTISSLQIGGVKPLIVINSAYDNSTWNMPDSETDVCKAESYEERFEIVKNKLDWYDIKVMRREYIFTEGCNEKVLKKETVKVYHFNNGVYKVD